MISFLTSTYHDIGIFSFHFAAIIVFLWPHGVLFTNLQKTQHNEIQEKAQLIRVNESYITTDALADRCC